MSQVRKILEDALQHKKSALERYEGEDGFIAQARQHLQENQEHAARLVVEIIEIEDHLRTLPEDVVQPKEGGDDEK